MPEKTQQSSKNKTGQKQDTTSSPSLNTKAFEHFSKPQNQAPYLAKMLKESDIPRIRRELTNKGIDGNGIKVIVGDLPGDLMPGKTHGQLVKSIVNDPLYGVAPKASTYVIELAIEPKGITDFPDSAQGMRDFILDQVRTLFKSTTSLMEDLLKKRSNDPSLRVVNFSLGHDLQTLSLFAALELITADEQTVNMRREIFGGKEVSFQGRRAPGVSPEQYRNERRAKYQTIADFVSKTLDESKEFKDILGSYQRLAQSMAEQGMFVVVAAGNEGVSWQGMKTTDSLNLLARSEHVISVGSAERNKTPLNLEDDNLASYSSIGQEGGWQPTLLAPSLEVPNFYGLEGSLDNTSSGEMRPSNEIGTSLSAPYVAGTISLMLQKNPKLSFNEVCAKLRSASIPIKQGATRAPSYVQGAGVLDPVKAVRSVETQ